MMMFIRKRSIIFATLLLPSTVHSEIEYSACLDDLKREELIKAGAMTEKVLALLDLRLVDVKEFQSDKYESPYIQESNRLYRKYFGDPSWKRDGDIEQEYYGIDVVSKNFYEAARAFETNYDSFDWECPDPCPSLCCDGRSCGYQNTQWACPPYFKLPFYGHKINSKTGVFIHEATHREGSPKTVDVKSNQIICKDKTSGRSKYDYREGSEERQCTDDDDKLVEIDSCTAPTTCDGSVTCCTCYDYLNVLDLAEKYPEAAIWNAENYERFAQEVYSFETSPFLYESGWLKDRYLVDIHPRMLGDIDGDGNVDIIGFGDRGVYVALGQGDGYFQYKGRLHSYFGFNEGWTVDFPRLLGDVNGDGKTDIVGFGYWHVYVAPGKADAPYFDMSTFQPNFSYDQGWRIWKHPRLLGDVNGDGRDDIVGFGEWCVYVGLGQLDGTFAPPYGSTLGCVLWDFCYDCKDTSDRNWRVETHPRLLGDVNGDNKADIVGFYDDGVYIALGKGDGTFGEPTSQFDFAGSQGWIVDRHPRLLGDVNGDGKADVVGFGQWCVYVGLGQPDGSFGPTDGTIIECALNDFCYDEYCVGGTKGGWRTEKHERLLGDVNGDNRTDIVGFYDDGVYVALGKIDGTFEEKKFALNNFGYNDDAGRWRVENHVRLLSDVNNDNKIDIVGFGDYCVYVALGQDDGTFAPIQCTVLSEVAPPRCFDGIQNVDEGGIDCGGTSCSPCPTCNDGKQNGDETGVDCGGSCPPCQKGPCNANPCSIGFTCIDLGGGNFRCQDNDPCDPDPCGTNQRCVDLGNGDYRCEDTGSGGGGGPGSGGIICFSGHAEVEVKGKGVTRMDALKIGDSVVTGDGTYSTVYSFGHYAPTTEMSYLQIVTNSMDKNHPLEISHEHLIYMHDQIAKKTQVLPAQDLTVGDYLVTETGPSPITSIRMVQRQGAYAPLTATGDIIVNGVLASNYVSREWLPNMVSGHVLHLLQHGAALPYRIFCSLVGCEGEIYDEVTGFSPWVRFWFGLEQWQLHLNGILQAVFLSFLVVPGMFAVFVGRLLSSPSSTTIQLVAALVGVLIWKKKHQAIKNAVWQQHQSMHFYMISVV